MNDILSCLWFLKKTNPTTIKENSDEKAHLIRNTQPTSWNKMAKPIKTPIFYSNYTNNERKIQELEILLKLKITRYQKNTIAINKAKSLHKKLQNEKIVHLMALNYKDWRTTSYYSKYEPLFIYIGSMNDNSCFTVVLDEAGNEKATYYEDNMSCNSISNMWNKALSAFDFNGAIQFVVLFDKIYDLAEKYNCPRLKEGEPIKNIWDKELDTFYASEINYEEIGFGKTLNTKTRSSMPSFACIKTYNGNRKSNIFYNQKESVVWHIEDEQMELIKTHTGETLICYDIKDKPIKFIAEKMSENEID